MALRATSQIDRTFIKPAYDLAKKVTPKISATEAAALDAGTIGFDRDIFAGTPSLKTIKDKYNLEISEEERAFVENEVNELCESFPDEYEMYKNRDLPKHIWDYIRQKGFLGMIISKEYGGKGFSAHGHAVVVQKISSKSQSVGVSVMVPNSLGPGELLARYGTDDQKNYFLPKLASGEYIPCFGLTGPASGSDAAAMRDTAIVCERDGVLGVSATFKKRYITLAPVAQCVGLAVNLKDPQGLLKGTGNEGITVFLLERDHDGLRMGPRHDPLAAFFMNGTVEGEEVFIPMDKIIGGQKNAGFGWNMLMDCLAEGRAISLPAGAIAIGKLSCNAVGAYARIRKQFKVPIANLEGVQEHLARIAGNTYAITAAQALTNSMLNQHEQPAVISAIMKQQCTSRGRFIANDAMDVLGGSGICMGPNNFMGGNYMSVPIAITVEGANTLTRSLIQFGQGLMRSHPHLLSVVRSIQDGNDMKGFNDGLSNMVKHGVTNSFSAFTKAFIPSPSKSNGIEAHYEAQLLRMAAAFAIASDLSLTLGGKIKFAEALSGRYADVLSNIYMGYAVLWFAAKRPVAGSEKVAEFMLQNIMCDAQDAMYGIFENFPIRPVGWFMQGLTFPTGKVYTRPDDKLMREVADLISKPSEVRELLAEDLFISEKIQTDRVAMMNHILPKACATDDILAQCRREKRSPTGEEQALIDEVEAIREMVIQVDSFDGLGQEINGQIPHWKTSDRPALQSAYPEEEIELKQASA
jgi:alkylation response protein AidB-like acyl-CoA dehydrogenase